MKIKEIFGCAAFGLADQVINFEGDRTGESFFLGDAVLPANSSGRIRTGVAAEEERIHSGLNWPPEARVGRDVPLRRAPIPCVWRGLLEAGDRSARWNVGRGVGFTMSRILSAHIGRLLEESGCKPTDMAVIAIPDALEEFGQEALLRDLKVAGFENVQLLWRPVAAALSWLSKLDQKNAFTTDASRKEHIIVICLAPDGLEIVTFQLHRKEYEGAVFVIPVRRRPDIPLPLTGFDWAANIIETLYPDLEDGAFWQAFTNFPHVWEAMSGRPFSSNINVWSHQGFWNLWKPTEALRQAAMNVPTDPNCRLRNLLANSCRLFEAKRESEGNSIGKRLEALLKSALESNTDSRLRGVIVSGPLCPPQLPDWIQSMSSDLKSRGIVKEASLSPELDAVWKAHKTDALADGCAEYGRRLDLGLPTYLDTLPQLSALAEQRGEHVWVDLLNAETCEGGKPFKPDPIRGKFAIQAGAKHLQVYLKKGHARGSRDFGSSEDKSPRKFTIPENKRAEIEFKVREAGAYDNAIKIFHNIEHEAGCYARKLARELFGNPFRRAEFPLPAAPDKSMPVDISVEIRPASGLAQITLSPSSPDDAAFLRGRQIFLDYSTMEEADPPPPPARGWPDAVRIKVDPYATFQKVHKYEINKFLNATPEDPGYMHAVDDIKAALTAPIFIDGAEFLMAMDQDGLAGTEEATRQIDRIAKKAEGDFPNVMQADKRKFVTRVSCFFAKTPKSVVQEIRKYIKRRPYGQNWNYGVEAAGRCFLAEEDFAFLYDEIFKRIRSDHHNPFPIESARALWRSLSLRKNSPKAMTYERAKTFTGEAVKIMEQETRDDNYKNKFFQAARLFLFLLRFRTVKPDFLDPDNKLDSDIFERTLNCLRAAERYFSRANVPGTDRARELVIGIEKFMRYEGSNDILAILDDLAG